MEKKNRIRERERTAQPKSVIDCPRSFFQGGEEGCFHSSDYFYEDEFSVQFDSNLRETISLDDVNSGPSNENLASDGSCAKFADEDLYHGPYESELSGKVFEVSYSF